MNGAPPDVREAWIAVMRYMRLAGSDAFAAGMPMQSIHKVDEWISDGGSGAWGFVPVPVGQALTVAGDIYCLPDNFNPKRLWLHINGTYGSARVLLPEKMRLCVEVVAKEEV